MNKSSKRTTRHRKQWKDLSIMNRTLELDMVTAERITRLSLQDHYEYLKEELRAHIEDGHDLHEDDVLKNHQLIYCLEKVIVYYGGPIV